MFNKTLSAFLHAVLFCAVTTTASDSLTMVNMKRKHKEDVQKVPSSPLPSDTITSTIGDRKLFVRRKRNIKKHDFIHLSSMLNRGLQNSSTKAPTGKCEDVEGKFKTENNGKKSCDFLDTVSSPLWFCKKDSVIRENCPETCDPDCGETTAPPVIGGECENVEGKFQTENKGTRGCDFLDTVSSPNWYCTKDPAFFENCPETCDPDCGETTAPPVIGRLCENVEGKFQTENKGKRGCDFLDTVSSPNWYCTKDPAFFENCPETCDPDCE
jgi:hypothetical protein